MAHIHDDFVVSIYLPVTSARQQAVEGISIIHYNLNEKKNVERVSRWEERY